MTFASNLGCSSSVLRRGHVTRRLPIRSCYINPKFNQVSKISCLISGDLGRRPIPSPHRHWHPCQHKSQSPQLKHRIYASGDWVDPIAFAFGTGNPNDETYEQKRWDALAAAIQQRGGVVTAEELAPFLVTSLDQISPETYYTDMKALKVDESALVMPALLRFKGEPFVDKDNNLLYKFKSLQFTGYAWPKWADGRRPTGMKWTEVDAALEKEYPLPLDPSKSTLQALFGNWQWTWGFMTAIVAWTAPIPLFMCCSETIVASIAIYSMMIILYSFSLFQRSRGEIFIMVYFWIVTFCFSMFLPRPISLHYALSALTAKRYVSIPTITIFIVISIAALLFKFYILAYIIAPVLRGPLVMKTNEAIAHRNSAKRAAYTIVDSPSAEVLQKMVNAASEAQKDLSLAISEVEVEMVKKKKIQPKHKARLVKDLSKVQLWGALLIHAKKKYGNSV